MCWAAQTPCAYRSSFEVENWYKYKIVKRKSINLSKNLTGGRYWIRTNDTNVVCQLSKLVD